MENDLQNQGELASSPSSRPVASIRGAILYLDGDRVEQPYSISLPVDARRKALLEIKGRDSLKVWVYHVTKLSKDKKDMETCIYCYTKRPQKPRR